MLTTKINKKEHDSNDKPDPSVEEDDDLVVGVDVPTLRDITDHCAEDSEGGSHQSSFVVAAQSAAGSTQQFLHNYTKCTNSSISNSRGK